MLNCSHAKYKIIKIDKQIAFHGKGQYGTPQLVMISLITCSSTGIRPAPSQADEILEDTTLWVCTGPGPHGLTRRHIDWATSVIDIDGTARTTGAISFTTINRKSEFSNHWRSTQQSWLRSLYLPSHLLFSLSSLSAGNCSCMDAVFTLINDHVVFSHSFYLKL